MAAAFSEDVLRNAHKHAEHNQTEVMASEICGCFQCLRTYAPSTITKWITYEEDISTAVCPGCDVDCVVGSAGGFPVGDEFLRAMHAYWME